MVIFTSTRDFYQYFLNGLTKGMADVACNLRIGDNRELRVGSCTEDIGIHIHAYSLSFCQVEMAVR